MAKKKNKDRSADIINEIQAFHFYYERVFDRAYSSLGISNEQHTILDILKDAENGLALNKIQALLPNQTTNTTRLVNKLHGKKFLVKKSNPVDKRQLLISITPLGIEVCNLAEELILPINKKIKKGINSAADKSLLADLKALKKLLKSFVQ